VLIKVTDLGISAAGYVPRAALVKKMRAIAVIPKHIYITAPGGYGKTVAVGQWLSSVRGKTAKMTVRDADNNSDIYYARLAASLLKLTNSKKHLSETAISFDQLLDIVNSLPTKVSRRYLAVDDVHLIENEETMEHAPLLAQCLPEYICLCIISRAEPAKQLLRTGLFEVLTKEDFLFSVEETEWLSMEREHDLSPEQIRKLQETTGGWAIYLSAMLSSGNTDEIKKDKVPMTLSQYLDERVWGLWNNYKQELILKLSVPDEVTPELCEHLTGETDGHGVLERLFNEGNAFLSRTDMDSYRFHDLFRDFLLERISGFFNMNEIQALNNIAAEWYYKQGDYFTGAKHFIYISDHDGINRCLQATSRFLEETSSMSVENEVKFVRQYILGLSIKVITENPFLLAMRVMIEFYIGNSDTFLVWLDSLYQKIPKIMSKHPEFMEEITFIGGLDYRIPLIKCARNLKKSINMISKSSTDNDVSHIVTITQNLPFFHRSMRDYSEYHRLKAFDLKVLRDTFGFAIGRDYDVMEPSWVAGIFYERGKLLDAMHHAFNAYRRCGDDMHPETRFSAYMIFSATLYAMGSSREADDIMEQAEVYIDHNAKFLHQNFKAIQTAQSMRKGDKESAREWLAIYAYTNNSGPLPFYQICRHFTTLRANIVLEEYAAAIMFGKRLLTLASDYKRPLDQIESSILVSIATWLNKKHKEAVVQLEQTIKIAEPYEFTQLFINEGKELLPLLWAIQSKKETVGKTASFVEGLIQEICKKYNLNPENNVIPKLTAQQNVMLTCLSKGMTYKEIAAETGLERSTVKYHVLQMYKRLGVHDSQEAVIKAKSLGLLE